MQNLYTNTTSRDFHLLRRIAVSGLVFFSLAAALLALPGQLFGQTGDTTEPVFPPISTGGETGGSSGSSGSGSTGSGETGSNSYYIDSLLYEGRMVRLTVRVSDEIRRDSVRLRALIDSVEHSMQMVIAANLRLNPDEWQPTEADRARRQEMLEKAQDFEYIYPQGVARIPVFSAPVGAIARSLGLIEDVTPRIAYDLPVGQRVTITIYTLSALKITTLFEGVERAGAHALEWDFKDSNGRRVLSGSYIAEVVGDGERLIMRKRIEVP